MKGKTKLFRHFITLLNIVAIALPLVTFGYYVANDALSKHYASQSVQHHGGTSDVFSDDLDYAIDNLTLRSIDDNFIFTLQDYEYYNFDSSKGITDIESWYAYYDGKSYATIISDNAVSNKFFLNLDFISMFDNGIVNNGKNVTTYLFVNFYINFIITMTLLCFMPSVILAFFEICKGFVYKFLDEGDY